MSSEGSDAVRRLHELFRELSDEEAREFLESVQSVPRGRRRNVAEAAGGRLADSAVVAEAAGGRPADSAVVADAAVG
jgi:predicted HAD superfamily phosphohydrolase